MANEPGKEIAKFADEAMFRAEKSTKTRDTYVPKATLLDAPSDPLGKLAAIAKAYQGKFPLSYADVSDEDRLYYVQDMEKNILGMPSESVMFHFVLENVTRSFTHQLVRTRHASYAQESMRFAVKEDFPVQLPPHLEGTLSREEWFDQQLNNSEVITPPDPDNEEADLWVERYASDKQKMRFVWDEAVDNAGDAYMRLIEMGLPAEDARGLAPHNVVTKLNWVIDLRALMQVAGQRLCTQAQWEHRMVWDSVIRAIRGFGAERNYLTSDPFQWAVDDMFKDENAGRDSAHPGSYAFEEVGDGNGNPVFQRSSAWQFEFLARRFKPICYQTGRCQFRSDFDRFCNIRDRVEEFAANGIPSSEWHEEGHETAMAPGQPGSYPIKLLPIHPLEWLNPNAAIREDAKWRNEQALRNIKGRR